MANRGGEHTGGAAKYGASVVRRWLERPTMHSPLAQSDGRPNAECNADSVESLAGSAITPAEPSDGCGDRRCGQQSR